MGTSEKIHGAELLKDSVASVGIFKPKFNPQAGKIFSDELQIIGTGFWVTGSDTKTLITCAHVVDGVAKESLDSKLLVIGYKHQYYRATVGTLDYLHDLAVLKVTDPISREPSQLEIAVTYPPVSTKVSWAGYPLGNFLLNEVHDSTYNEGVVGIQKRSEPTRKVVQVSGTVVGGYSGSPIIDQQTSHLVGVVSNGPENTGIFMATSFEHVAALLTLNNS